MSWNNDIKPEMNTEFLATEALDFLLTENGYYLVTNQSTIWTRALKTITNWINISK